MIQCRKQAGRESGKEHTIPSVRNEFQNEHREKDILFFSFFLLFCFCCHCFSKIRKVEDWLVQCFSQGFSREREIIECIKRERCMKRDLFVELAHSIIEAEKSHNRLFISWRTREDGSMDQSKVQKP